MALDSHSDRQNLIGDRIVGNYSQWSAAINRASSTSLPIYGHMNTRAELANSLAALANAEIERQRAQVAELPLVARAGLLVEACRVIDFHHVVRFMSSKPELGLSEFEFATILRGWNPLAAMLLPHIGNLRGIPFRESTPELRESVLGILMNLGRASFVRENAEMLRHGMNECTLDGTTVTFRMTDRYTIDHFLDGLEADKLKNIEDAMPSESVFKKAIRETEVDNLDERIRELVHPFRPRDDVTMVSYDSAPDIEQHYFALVAKDTHESVDEAGIHDDTVLGNITGKDLRVVVFLITSFYLKHIRFVDVAKKAFPEVNVPMSLTAWTPPDRLIESIASFTGIDPSTVTSALDMLTVNSGHASYFEQEVTPLLPMLIKVSDDYVLQPVSSVFRNPFHGIRMLHEAFDKHASDNLRKHREDWMISELYNLFLGLRYLRMEGPTKLRQGRQVVTDIDAAVFDTMTGELALFQLKWQDFSSNDVAKQRSRAKNFVEKVDAWAKGVQGWIAASGTTKLIETIRLRQAKEVSQVRLFAIGRSSARFQSYGFELQENAVAPATWRQFARLRYTVGPSDNVLQDLHEAIQTERTTSLKLRPVRQEFSFRDHTIVLENLFNEYDDHAGVATPAPGWKHG
ncbi:hypothetical protein [Bradyrhizobium diazoefficiens]|uniref:hypothetical protein n=1 Tax=Bradyrhizobium diazoefficiens TaxID=1355477 RepID=UPI0004BB1A8F|nr:hypothetical protein [Bradyrhizobium diazoefficiens]